MPNIKRECSICGKTCLSSELNDRPLCSREDCKIRREDYFDEKRK